MQTLDIETIQDDYAELVASIKTAMRFVLRNDRQREEVVADAKYVSIDRRTDEVLFTTLTIGGEWEAACGEVAEAKVTFSLDRVVRTYWSDRGMRWECRYFIQEVD